MEFTPRQEEIISNAVKLIDKKGIQGLTIKNLATEMQFTEAALYRHFPNKLAILTAIISKFKNQTYESIKTNYEQSPINLKTIFNHLQKLSLYFESNPSIVSVIFAEEIFQNHSSLQKKILELFSMNEEFFAEGIKNSDIRNKSNPQITALCILGSYRLLVKKWKLHNKPYSLVGETKNLINYLENTL
jgi:AcrR family transcriptional regulator